MIIELAISIAVATVVTVIYDKVTNKPKKAGGIPNPRDKK